MRVKLAEEEKKNVYQCDISWDYRTTYS